MNDHTNLIRWFCLSTADGQSSHIPDLHKAYFGDREIIQGKLTEYVKQPKHQCNEANIEYGSSNYTYEPYALVVSLLERPELAQFVQRRTYEFRATPGGCSRSTSRNSKCPLRSPTCIY
jgi:hypothetical protein